MRKLLLSIFAFCLCTMAFAGDALYKTLTFPEGNSKKVGSYTDTWTATCEDFTWTISNFNNNNNTWDVIKCGRKSDPSVASISTPQVSETITKVVVTFNAVKPDKVNEAYLQIASDANFSTDVQKTPIDLAASEVTILVPTPKANQFYRLVFDCQEDGKSNGFIWISKVQLYKFDSSSISNPIIAPNGGNFYEPVQVTIDGLGADVYYSINDGEYSKYTAPITISETSKLSAYAQSGEQKSKVVTSQYKIAKTYDNLNALIGQIPTADGWPVIVPLNEVEITGFVGSDTFRSGVYVNTVYDGDKYLELYCNNADLGWQIGNKLVGTAKGIYQNYQGQWEISLVSWEGISVLGGVSAPKISFDKATATVTITDPSGEDNTIYYTLNGSDPDDSSILYEGPFVIETAVQVRAICYNDDDQKSAITTETCIPAAAPYKTIAELIANCTATSQNDAPTVTFTFENIIVTGVNGANIFIQDATGSFLLYGKNAQFQRGDVLTGTLSGKLYSYNGLPELSVSDWAGASGTSFTSVTPRPMNAKDVTKANASEFVLFEGVKYQSTDTSGKHAQYNFDQNGASINIFDQFDQLKDIAFNTEDKYNLNVFVIPFKENIQYYAVSADDIEVISDKQDPKTTFINIAYLEDKTDGSFPIKSTDYETLSDGAKTFTSSNEAVATVDNEGIVTIKGVGVAVITLTTAATEKYSEGRATTNVCIVSHINVSPETDEILTGRKISDPWEACDVNPMFIFAESNTTSDPVMTKQWFHGFIVGFADGSLEKAAFTAEGAVASNVLISSNKNATDVKECVPVALATSPAECKAVRAALNLKDNPGNLGKEVWFCGDIQKYFSVAGVKTVTDYSFDLPSSITDMHMNDITDTRIFNLKGQLLSAPQKGAINIIQGKKVFVK
ncbi:MAG: chitobiase/beta-hexosaminidase C-terminal domain-containing protein [Prevotellaceae bacterium]|nr:chitobiase/beta-hexosaminidase C-terminal domain-containing protein [Candidatus Colivivens equi]